MAHETNIAGYKACRYTLPQNPEFRDGITDRTVFIAATTQKGIAVFIPPHLLKELCPPGKTPETLLNLARATFFPHEDRYFNRPENAMPSSGGNYAVIPWSRLIELEAEERVPPIPKEIKDAVYLLFPRIAREDERYIASLNVIERLALGGTITLSGFKLPGNRKNELDKCDAGTDGQLAVQVITHPDKKSPPVVRFYMLAKRALSSLLADKDITRIETFAQGLSDKAMPDLLEKIGSAQLVLLGTRDRRYPPIALVSDNPDPAVIRVLESLPTPPETPLAPITPTEHLSELSVKDAVTALSAAVDRIKETVFRIDITKGSPHEPKTVFATGREDLRRKAEPLTEIIRSAVQTFPPGEMQQAFSHVAENPNQMAIVSRDGTTPETLIFSGRIAKALGMTPV